MDGASARQGAGSLALMLVLRVRVPVALLIAPAATIFIHLVFYKGLRVPLPWGILPVLY